MDKESEGFVVLSQQSPLPPPKVRPRWKNVFPLIHKLNNESKTMSLVQN